MTATTSPSDSASPSEPHETGTTPTGPVGSKAASRSSSTPKSPAQPAQEQGAAEGAHDESAARERYVECFRADLACLLLELRRNRDWSVYDLERHTGVSRSTLSRIERAVTEPSMAVLVRVCLAYGYPISRLVAEVEAQQPEPWPSCATQ
ncbi:helix-turn-helix transcriptional regulator [Streptomyces sp. NPDC006332]|uniref:helix-turn-helix domain-containing protein n=1 Tax=Streptomyces sp. NPDC006332 TaxID=3155456 RepID=UPI0033A98E9F